MPFKKIKVLIVDDSMVFRETLARGIAADPAFEVVGTAADPYMARDEILKHEPDVMTLDVEMPRMNGIDFLKRLIPQYPIPVVVVSAVDQSVFDALNAGAVDFVAKPDLRNGHGLDSLINELIVKLKIASTAKVGAAKQPPADKHLTGKVHSQSGCDIIAIGASTGGTEAIARIITEFPGEMPGIVIVQHIPAVFSRMYAERLNHICPLEVKEAQNGDGVLPGRVLVAPGDYQMRLHRTGGQYSVECFQGEKVNGHAPSVDVLFHSVAEIAGEKAIGVILTGMGYDGAKGLLHMRENGARTVGQDEASSVVYGMPKVAFELGAVERQVALDVVPQTIFSWLSGGTEA